jgi:hypothetical protein
VNCLLGAVLIRYDKWSWEENLQSMNGGPANRET